MQLLLRSPQSTGFSWMVGWGVSALDPRSMTHHPSVTPDLLGLMRLAPSQPRRPATPQTSGPLMDDRRQTSARHTAYS